MSAYYNENDKTAAAWLRELIDAGLIAAGDVDERDIRDVRPSDLAGYHQIHLFAGIGGWSYALRLAGWPDDQSAWTGSCPCQPFSQAGKGKGEDDPRHLWPEMRRLIEECQPTICFGEQVASPAGRQWLDRVSADLEALGFAVGAADLCAAGVGAPHIRQRLWWVADAQNTNRGSEQQPGKQTEHGRPRFTRGCRVVQPNGKGWQSGESSAEAARYRSAIESTGSNDGVGNTVGPRPQERISNTELPATTPGPSPWKTFVLASCRDGKQRRIEPGLEPLADGIPGRVGLLRGYGNAIVPQVAAEFIGAYLDTLLS